MKTLKVIQILDTYSTPSDSTSAAAHLPVYVYQVEKVTNSITPNVSERLSRDELDFYCQSEDWQVTIV